MMDDDDPLLTRPSLLARVRDLKDQQAWAEFVALYTPVIQSYLRRRGLQDADSSDVTQETLGKITRAIGRLEYDRGKGRFRGWLLTITRNNLIDHVNRNRSAVTGSGDTRVHALLDAQPAEAEFEQWDRDCQQQVMHHAMQRAKDEVEPNTWQAFYATAIQAHTAEAVAERLGMSTGAVYIAKSRVTARLRRIVSELEEDS